MSRREHNDPIREELSDPHRPLAFSEITMRGFDDMEAERFIAASPLQNSLSPDERQQLIDLTEGKPLWLALAIEYLTVSDLPPEMTTAIDDQGRTREQFQRRLVTLYRSTDFWPEAIKRLAVVRHSVNQQVWRELMDDRELPPDAQSWEQAWELLLRRPWVRPRANQRYVTLHDALAEELAQRLIPLHDQDEAWRRDLWRKAKDIYTRLTSATDERLRVERSHLAAELESRAGGDTEHLGSRVAELDAEKRELDQLLTAQLHYEILDDFQSGTDRFLELRQQALDLRDPLFMELICHEVERFIPRGETSEPLEDVMDVVLQRFRRWLQDDAPVRYIEIAIQISGFLLRNEQPRDPRQAAEHGA